MSTRRFIVQVQRGTFGEFPVIVSGDSAEEAKRTCLRAGFEVGGVRDLNAGEVAPPPGGELAELRDEVRQLHVRVAEATDGISKLPSWGHIFAVVIVANVVLWILVMTLGGR